MHFQEIDYGFLGERLHILMYENIMVLNFKYYIIEVLDMKGIHFWKLDFKDLDYEVDFKALESYLIETTTDIRLHRR